MNEAFASASLQRESKGFFLPRRRIPVSRREAKRRTKTPSRRGHSSSRRTSTDKKRVGARALEPRARRLRSESKEGPSLGSSRRGQARVEAPEVACRRHPPAAADASAATRRSLDARDVRDRRGVGIALARAAGWPPRAPPANVLEPALRDRERTARGL